MIPAAVYGVKSSPEDKDSVRTQVAACLAAIDSEGGRTLVAEPFTEQKVSGSSANRGPQLEAAIRTATQAAECHGEAELWVWHTSRLARGSGRKDEARALGKLLYDLREAGVTVRSVEDDQFATDEMLWGIASKMASKYTDDLRAWVKRGKQRDREAGRYLGGPVPDGYRQDRRPDGTDPETGEQRWKPDGPRVIDRDREPVIARAFELELSVGDKDVAERLNIEGHRRKSGKRFDRRTIQSMVTNPHYAGRLKQRDGSAVPAIIAPDLFDAVQAARAGRDRAAAGRKRAKDGMPLGGRPTGRYVLAKLAKCARCGGTMYASTSPYTRKDGTKKRSYICANSPSYSKTTATCDAPKVDGETVDSAIIPHLRGFFVDFDGWFQRVTDAEAAGREDVRREVEDCRARVAELGRAHDRAHQRYEAALGDAQATPARLTALEDSLERVVADRAQTEAHLCELEEALSSLENSGAPVDAMLDWWNALSAGLRGALDSAQSVAEVNARLRDVLSEVHIDTLPNGRIALHAIFADRGQCEFPVDQDWNPVFDAEPDFFPDQADIYVRPGYTLSPSTLPIETGSITHE